MKISGFLKAFGVTWALGVACLPGAGFAVDVLGSSPFKAPCSEMIEKVARERAGKLSDKGQQALLSIYERCLDVGADSFQNPNGVFVRSSRNVWIDEIRKTSRIDYNSEFVSSVLENAPQDMLEALERGSIKTENLSNAAIELSQFIKETLTRKEISALLGKTLGLTAMEISEAAGIKPLSVADYQRRATNKIQTIINSHPVVAKGITVVDMVSFMFLTICLAMAAGVLAIVAKLILRVFGVDSDRRCYNPTYEKQYAKDVVREVAYVSSR